MKPHKHVRVGKSTMFRANCKPAPTVPQVFPMSSANSRTAILIGKASELCRPAPEQLSTIISDQCPQLASPSGLLDLGVSSFYTATVKEMLADASATADDLLIFRRAELQSFIQSQVDKRLHQRLPACQHKPSAMCQTTRSPSNHRSPGSNGNVL